MKKALSLLLVIAMVCTCLSSLALATDKPAAAAEADAGVKVVTASGETAYFATLNNEVVNWSLEQAGGATITVLKDLEVTSEGTGSRFISLPAAWSDANPLVLDLNGKTVTYSGAANVFTFDGDGSLTVKNGTLIRAAQGTRNVFAFGTSSSSTLAEDGKTLLTPTLTIENAHVYSLAKGEAGFIFVCRTFTPTINVKDSTLWTLNSENYTVAHLVESSQSKAAVKYEGAFAPVLNIEGSVVGTGGAQTFTNDTDGVTVNVKDSILASAEGVVLKDSKAFTLNGENKATATIVITLPDGTQSKGAGVTFGNAPTAATEIKAVQPETPAAPAQPETPAVPAQPETPAAPSTPTTPSVPTTPVPDVEVPKTGASVIALGVMAMVSLAGAVVTKKH